MMTFYLGFCLDLAPLYQDEHTLSAVTTFGYEVSC